MQTLRLNNSTQMPAFGLGTWKSGPGEVKAAVLEAVRAGYRHIDCAWIYRNEPEIGEALQELLHAGAVEREELWVTSKLWNDRHAAEDVEPALRDSLQSLKLDYLDLYLIHWPVALRRGTVFPQGAEDMLPLSVRPMAETWQALERCVDLGLTRGIGVSNFSLGKLDALLEQARLPPAVNQIELHPYLQQNEMLASCKARGVALTAYSPLGSMDRPSFIRGEEDPVLLEDDVVRQLAQKHGATPAQVLIAWALHRGTAVIPKSIRPQRIRENLQAVSLQLDADDMRTIAALDRHRRYVDGRIWAIEGSGYTVETLWDE